MARRKNLLIREFTYLCKHLQPVGIPAPSVSVHTALWRQHSVRVHTYVLELPIECDITQDIR